MSAANNGKARDGYQKAEDLKLVFEFEMDNSTNSFERTQQVREIMTQMLLLARKRGRPSQKEEEVDDIAA